MSISFPFTFVDLGNPLPFNIQANPDFPDETDACMHPRKPRGSWRHLGTG